MEVDVENSWFVGVVPSIHSINADVVSCPISQQFQMMYEVLKVRKYV